MNFEDLIKQATVIAEKYPWNDFSKDHNIIFESNDNFYAVEFSNNKCIIYPNVNNVYIYEHSKEVINKINNLYQLENYSRNLYHQLEFISFEYVYPINMPDDVKRLYSRLGINLDTNQKYISLLHKKVCGNVTLMEEELVTLFNTILNLLNEFLEYMESKKNLISEDRIILFANHEVNLIKLPIFLVMLEQRLHYPIHEYNSVKQKELRRRLIIDMRFLGPIEKEDFQIILAAYDDSAGKLLIPLGMREVNPKHIKMYLTSLFEKGIYKIIEVGNVELYQIIKRTMVNFNCEIVLCENQELFDCIYEDYERIILNNSRIEVKK